MRSLIPKHLQDLFKKEANREEDSTREFSSDTHSHLELRSISIAELAHYSKSMKARENLFHWQSLSPREKEVVALICMGQRNYQIAETLGIAHGTVKSHLENILRKFNVSDRHAIRLALSDWDFPTWWRDRHLLPTPMPSKTIYR